MTPAERLKDIEERLKNATPGPWSYDLHEEEIHSDTMQDSSGDPAHIVFQLGVRKLDNGTFIAHAPEDVAWLLDEVKRLQEFEWMYKDLCK